MTFLFNFIPLMKFAVVEADATLAKKSYFFVFEYIFKLISAILLLTFPLSHLHETMKSPTVY